MSKKIKKIAVFTSGGDAPGMNAALRAVIRSATHKDLLVYGIKGGYEGMIHGHISKMSIRDVGNIIQKGGTILKTARSMEFMTPEGRKKAFDQLTKNGIDGLVALGGNGTFTGADLLYQEHKMPVVGVPCTIDNDLYGTDFTIGFDTAVNTAVEAVDKIRDTAESHNRLFLIEVMGRHAGFLALYTAISSGASKVLLPESNISLEDFITALEDMGKRRKLFSLVVVAEGNKLGNANDLAKSIKARLTMFDVRVAVIGHLQRGGAPSGFDRLLASRLGDAAVNALIEGMDNVMVGIVNNQLKHTPLLYAIKNEKELNLDMVRLSEMLAM